MDITQFGDKFVLNPQLIEKVAAAWRLYGRRLEEPVFINSDIIIVANPVAGKGRAREYVKRLSTAIAAMVAYGNLKLAGCVSCIMTEADPAERIKTIATALMTAGVSNPPYVIAVGGDGTFADVGMAALIAAKEGRRSFVIPTNEGTACDMRRELGTPRDPEKLIRFLATGLPVKLSAISVSMDDEPERVLFHSMGCGVSGTVFSEVERSIRNNGYASISAYLKGLVKGVIRTQPFFASVDGSDPVAVGEVLTLSNSTSIGGVTRVPLPVDGGRIHLLPVDVERENIARLERGVTALADVFGRGLSYMAGDDRVIAPGEEIPILSAGYTIDIMERDRREVVLTDALGRPARINAILNGDAIGEVSRVTFCNRGESIDSLASYGSGYMVRSGKSPPKTPFDKVSEYANGVGSRFAFGADVFRPGGIIEEGGSTIPVEEVEENAAVDGVFEVDGDTQNLLNWFPLLFSHGVLPIKA